MREFQDYFVDGMLLAMRWNNQGEAELREWCEIGSISGNEMVWTALRQNTDGSIVQQDMKCKKFLNQILNEFLEPMRQRRHEFEQDIPEIYNILRKGTEKARETAAQTMDEVRRAMRINYFDDEELIRSQAERFRAK